MREDPLAQRLRALLEPAATAQGFRLVRVRMTGQGGSRTLQLMAEREDGTMTVEDCADLSRALSAILDVEDPVEGHYSLEISSPGIDRPLVSLVDFAAYAGHWAKVKLDEAIDGRKRFQGVLRGVEDDIVLIETEDAGQWTRHALPFSELSEAKLLLTDELIEEALKKNPALAQDPDEQAQNGDVR